MNKVQVKYSDHSKRTIDQLMEERNTANWSANKSQRKNQQTSDHSYMKINLVFNRINKKRNKEQTDDDVVKSQLSGAVNHYMWSRVQVIVQLRDPIVEDQGEGLQMRVHVINFCL